MSFRASLALLIAVACGSCAAGTSTPKTQVFILVDLSKTWHNPNNPDQHERNLRVLQEVGHGVAIAADEMEQPILIQTRVIGTKSLEREPVCNTIFESSFAPIITNDIDRISSDSGLDSYLSSDCPRKLLEFEPEMQTEISSALISVANQDPAGASKRYLIILSDFLEDAAEPVNVPKLAGFNVLLIYRPVTEDYQHPEGMAARVDAWKDAIGATNKHQVISVPDTGLRREVLAELMRRNLPAHD